jgi:predicted metal-binding protein
MAGAGDPERDRRFPPSCEKTRHLNAELAEKCNHEETKTRKVRCLSSCLRAFGVAFNTIKELLCGLRGLCV